ncbi:MAG TPA: hypothetical protein VGJ26_17875 [Pirellulales bacterium]
MRQVTVKQAVALLAIALGSFLLVAEARAAGAPSSPRAQSGAGAGPGQGRQLPARRPSVSPYMNLLNNQNPNLTNYQSLVRPQVNQARISSQQNSRINRLEAPPPASGNSGSQTLRSTGHQATYGNYSHFYPNFPGRR